MNINVIGTGYVGLVSGAGLADFGNHVVCSDINKDKIDLLKNGKIPFYEPGLMEFVKRNVDAGRLSFSNEVGESIKDANVIFIAVWTPMSDNGEANLTAIENVAETIGRNLNDYKVVCTKSTVPVGTGEKIRKLIEKSKKSMTNFDVVSNPEFLREGSSVKDFLIPNRVIIGVESEKAKEIMRNVYRPLFINETPIVFTDVKTAETIKYASNAFLAVKISYINEIANLCDATGADVQVVSKAMGLDKRIGSKFLHPGPGYGGSCFPKDTNALVKLGNTQGVDLTIVKAAIKTNFKQREKVYNKLKKLFNYNVNGKTIAILGLAFKSNTDDVRQSSAIYFIEKLLDEGASVKAFDPVANENMKRLFPEVNYCDTLEDAVTDTDGVVVLTEWNEIRGMDLEKVSKLVKTKVLLDAKNMLNPRVLKRLGFTFENVGRPNVR